MSVLDHMPVQGRDDIAGDNASFGRGALCLWLGDKRTLSSLEAETVCNVGGDRLNLNADPAAADKSLVLKLSNYRLYGLSGNVEGNANRTTRWREDRGVHSDDVAAHVKGRTTGIALIHRRVDLDIVVIRARTDVAVASRNDASCYRPIEAEWVANRNHPVADARRRCRKFDEGEVTATIYLDQGEVGTRIGADHLAS